jgi:hypothetical protein
LILDGLLCLLPCHGSVWIAQNGTASLGKPHFRWNNRWKEEKAIVCDFMGKLQSVDKKPPLLMVPKGESQELEFDVDGNDSYWIQDISGNLPLKVKGTVK